MEAKASVGIAWYRDGVLQRVCSIPCPISDAGVISTEGLDYAAAFGIVPDERDEFKMRGIWAEAESVSNDTETR